MLFNIFIIIMFLVKMLEGENLFKVLPIHIFSVIV